MPLWYRSEAPPIRRCFVIRSNVNEKMTSKTKLQQQAIVMVQRPATMVQRPYSFADQIMAD